MGAAEHRIGKVVFEVAASDRAAVTGFNETVRARFDAVVMPALQSALDRIDRPGAIIRYGRVEVKLGSLDPSATAEELGRRIAEGLAAGLRAAAPSEPPLSPPDGEGAIDFAEFAAFLETGELPWAEPGRVLATLAAALMALDRPSLEGFAQRLRAVLIRRRAAERLVRQLPAVLVRRLLRALLPDVFSIPLTAAVGPDEAIATASERRVPEPLVPELTETIHRLARNGSPPDLGRILALFAALGGRTSPVASPSPNVTPQTRETTPLEQRAPTERSESDSEDHRTRVASRPIHAAGAVLLHPFLGAFFERLGLLEAPGRFRDRTARARAVLLAHHLATGAADAPEPEATLFKLLCGMTFAEPLPRGIEMTEAERAECASVLESLIARWTRLGKTSPDGLREGFLTRPGRLDQRDERWRLTVESRGIDVLLDGLPWPLSIVRTPFMTTILSVDWR